MKSRRTKIIAKETLMEVLGPALQGLSILNDNEFISAIKKVPEGFEMTVEVQND
jgi:hypothetical protein